MAATAAVSRPHALGARSRLSAHALGQVLGRGGAGGALVGCHAHPAYGMGCRAGRDVLRAGPDGPQMRHGRAPLDLRDGGPTTRIHTWRPGARGGQQLEPYTGISELPEQAGDTDPCGLNQVHARIPGPAQLSSDAVTPKRWAEAGLGRGGTGP